jgi:hypothetical protein
MNLMSLNGPRLIGIAVFAIALPQLASASDRSSSPTFTIAMGPTSAALTNQAPPTTSGSGITNCGPTETTCAKSHHQLRTKRTDSK